MKILYKMIIVLMTLTICLAYIPTLSKAQTAVVNTEGLNLRKEPNKDSTILDRTFRK